MEVEKDTKDIQMIEVPFELLQNIRKLFEVTNERITWKLEELLPVGITIQQLDELLKKNGEDK
tara:strand:+ start:946 stop:1134 length:189 start_codon:yes stop_codon:yes gene_type:complete